MTLKIQKKDGNLFLICSSEWWVDHIIDFFSKNEEDESISVKGMYNFKRSDVFIPTSSFIDEYKAYINSNIILETVNKPVIPKEIIFILGTKDDDYFRIRSDILGTENDILIHTDCEITEKYFFLSANVFFPHKYSFLIELEKLSNKPIVIGGDVINSIPEDIFVSIIDSFPTKTELEHYSNARTTNVLSEYLEGVTDSQNKYEKYLKKRNKIQISPSSFEGIDKYELEKYTFIRNTLKDMLSKSESYNEKKWETEILKIILILFPKYIEVFHSVPVIDYYTNPLSAKTREIDIILLDTNFHLDIIEIKKPIFNDIISQKPHGRDNHVPLKNLSSTVMQVEKYIFHLSKGGRDWEKALFKKYGKEIKIINPKGILIMGRSEGFDNRQKMDFEIIKRQYSNIVDIITYDDLLGRLDNIIARFSK